MLPRLSSEPTPGPVTTSSASVACRCDPEPIAKLVATVAAPAATLFGVVSRKRRLRHEIRENLALVKELKSDEALWKVSPAGAWLQGKIALDVARLAGQPLGTRKKPIPWGSVVLAGFLFIVLACGRPSLLEKTLSGILSSQVQSQC